MNVYAAYAVGLLVGTLLGIIAMALITFAREDTTSMTVPTLENDSGIAPPAAPNCCNGNCNQGRTCPIRGIQQ